MITPHCSIFQIYELNLISPGILLAVLPQLEFKLKSSDESERMGSVALLARCQSYKTFLLATDAPD
jgi:sister chromatid cohesion protein PDS5